MRNAPTANAPFRLLHGQCLAAAGRPDEARTVADGLTDGPDDAAFWLALGTLRQQLNAHEAARADGGGECRLRRVD